MLEPLHELDLQFPFEVQESPSFPLPVPTHFLVLGSHLRLLPVLQSESTAQVSPNSPSAIVGPPVVGVPVVGLAEGDPGVTVG